MARCDAIQVAQMKSPAVLSAAMASDPVTASARPIGAVVYRPADEPVADPAMKILQITAGAAGMFCGSCTRDNALARELLSRGHDVTLVPVYTPTSPDEPNVSRSHVLFGGISVYLQQHSAIFRRTPRFLDRVLDAPGVIGALD